jgi:formylglycine-generating enzyme required for sulfatase activity
MKPRILLVFLFFYIPALYAQQKTIQIMVDVLGEKDNITRYYHPIEGRYIIKKDLIHFDKKLMHQLRSFSLIQPVEYLNDSVTIVLANSLRYYIDPSELLYVNWGAGLDSLKSKIIIDSIRQVLKDKHKNHEQLIKRYFKPFFMKRHEVSNREYHEFVLWVKDSLFKEQIILCDSIPFEVRLNMLNIPKDELKYGVYSEKTGEFNSMEEIGLFVLRGVHSFKQDLNVSDMIKEYGDEIMPRISRFFLHPNTRWYKRRELDVSKLNYKYYYLDPEIYETDITGDRRAFIHEKEINIYPDTLSWTKGYTYTFNDPFSNMYNWHPAYDNFPVVGVSWEQAKAFLDWKTKKLQDKFPEIFQYFSLELPRIYEYEWAAGMDQGFAMRKVTQDQNLMTDLLLGTEDGKHGVFHEAMLLRYGLYMNKIYLPCDISNSKCLKEALKTVIWNAKDDEVSEYIEELIVMRAGQNYLSTGIEFLSNNVSEWMSEDYEGNYQKLFEAYKNYNSFADVDYYANQMNIDNENDRMNDKKGKLIMGANWYDERYQTVFGVNAAGIYPKTFRAKDSSYCTVGFRYVLRLKPSYHSWNIEVD